MVEKKETRLSLVSNDADESASANKSQMRRRFDLGGQTSSASHDAPRGLGATHPNVQTRKTTRPGAPASTIDEDPVSKRPTIPTPRPRLSLGAIPRRIIDNNGVMLLPLDHRAAFVLMHIDGKTNMRSLIDVTGMVAEEVVAMVERLLELHAIALV